MSEIPPVSGGSSFSSPAQEAARAIPAQIESSLSTLSDIPSKSCLEAFFDFLEWICASLFCCFKIDDLQVKEIVDQILELCKKTAEDAEENAKKPEEYLKLYFQLSDPARREIKEIAREYACCEFYQYVSKNQELSGEAFLRILSQHKEKLTDWIQKNQGNADKAANDLLKKETVYFYAIDTILETYLAKLQSRIDN